MIKMYSSYIDLMTVCNSSKSTPIDFEIYKIIQIRRDAYIINEFKKLHIKFPQEIDSFKANFRVYKHLTETIPHIVLYFENTDDGTCLVVLNNILKQIDSYNEATHYVLNNIGFKNISNIHEYKQQYFS